MLGRFYQNLCIKNKILLSFVFVLIVSFTTIGVLYNTSFQKSMKDFAEDSTFVIIEQASRQIETRIDGIRHLITQVESRDDVKAFMNSATVSSDELSLTRIGLRNMLDTYRELYSEVSSITLISKNGDYISNEMYKPQWGAFADYEWFRDCMEHGDELRVVSNPVSRNLIYYEPVSIDGILCLAKAVSDEDNRSTGIVMIDLKLEAVEDALESIVIGKEGFVAIMDSNEQLIYSPVNKIVPHIRESWFNEKSGVLVKEIMNERFQFIYLNISGFDWKVMGVFSLSSTLQQVTDTRNILIIILCCSAFVAFVMAVAFSSSIVKPIKKLETLMAHAQDGDLSVRFNVLYEDEIGNLGTAFNDMLAQMQMLVAQVFSEQKKKRIAELKALQEQIKPHFLYNTFDTINWMARKYDAEDIVYVVHCLTNIFRTGLSSGSEIITLREEVAHVENYLKIQKVRYGDILEYNIDIADELKDCYVYKLILQPVVENALYHGIKRSRRKGNISISAYREGETLCLVVKDDGVGMEEEQVSKLNAIFQNGNNTEMGYGLFNVDQRIKLSYGNDYGLHIDSIVGKGTVVTITIKLTTPPRELDNTAISADLLTSKEEDEC